MSVLTHQRKDPAGEQKQMQHLWEPRVPTFFKKEKIDTFSVLLCCFYNLFCPDFYQLYTRTSHWLTDRLFPWPCFICILFTVCVFLYTCENSWKSHRGLAKESCYLSWINSWYEKVNLIYFVIFCFMWI